MRDYEDYSVNDLKVLQSYFEDSLRSIEIELDRRRLQASKEKNKNRSGDID